MSETQPPTEFIPLTPAQLLLERIRGGLLAQNTLLGDSLERVTAGYMALTANGLQEAIVINEQLQDEITKLDAGQIPESIREAYEALQAHGKSEE